MNLPPEYEHSGREPFPIEDEPVEPIEKDDYDERLPNNPEPKAD